MIEPDDWRRLKGELARVLELEPAQRARELARLAQQDPHLAGELEHWLARRVDLGEFLETPPAGVAPIARLALGPEARIGRYTVRAVLGLGGSCVVLEAEQDSPRRRVALKVLQRGLDSAATLRRFLDEARALALLDHPAIARVLEYDTFPQDGRLVPFLALELVEGASDLLTHARTAGLARGARLALFVTLCDAIGQGHARGVIHRDLKPANVLIDRQGALKVIDFGIARILGAGPESERLTWHGSPLGTPDYMSPEQARGAREVDAHSDVWALGVLLHELVLDTPPRAGRIVSRHGLPGDLAALITRALEERPEERYPDAAAFGADVRRFLAQQPVEARLPSFVHQARLFVRRNRRACAALALFGVAFVGALAAALWHGARVAERERARTQDVNDFLMSLLEDSRPREGAQGKVSWRDVLLECAQRLEGKLADAPDERLRLHSALADALHDQGELAAACAQMEKALLLERARGDEARLVCMLNGTGALYAEAGATARAEELLRESLRLQEGGAHPPLYAAISANHLARALLRAGRLDESEACAREAHAVYVRELGERHPGVAASERVLGDLARARGEVALAETHYFAALSIHLTSDGFDSMPVAQDRLLLGELFLEAGELARAREELRRAVNQLADLVPTSHPDLERARSLFART